MTVVCDKRAHGSLCQDCKHSIPHDEIATCKGSLCIAYCLQFAYKNITCDICSMKDDCMQYVNGSRVSLFTHGEDCDCYKRMRVYAKCKQC